MTFFPADFYPIDILSYRTEGQTNPKLAPVNPLMSPPGEMRGRDVKSNGSFRSRSWGRLEILKGVAHLGAVVSWHKLVSVTYISVPAGSM